MEREPKPRKGETEETGPGGTIMIPRPLANELIRVCVEALPKQAYGMMGGKDITHPTTLYPCSTNLRNAPEWSRVFESFGEFYNDPGRGFVVSPEEYREITRQMRKGGTSFVGVFHSHRWHGPNPTEADMALHVGPRVLCYIVSVVSPARPRLKVYRLLESRCETVPHRVVD